jgi:voltage-gated potassium channel Kch|eukprot:scaffold3260_cov285-Chaetoceros_neogracile.AAC.13
MALGLPPESVRPFQLQLARVLLSLFTLLSVSSGLIYTTEHGVNPDIPDYFSALYFGLTTLTTVGFGDIAPVTPQGRLVVCASILAGVAVIPAQAASLLDAILEYQNEGKLKQSSLAEAEINVSRVSPRVSGDTKTKIVSPSKEQDKSLKEVRSIEETVSMLLTSISQLEQSGDSSVEEIEDIRESIAGYVNLREGLETTLENILKKVNTKE